MAITDATLPGIVNSARAQEALDLDGEYTFDPATEYHVPLFAFHKRRLSGSVNANWMGHAAYLAFSRGYIPAAAFRPDGVELHNSYFWNTRDAWSNGPQDQPPGARWASVRRMRFDFTFTKLDGTDWQYVGIAGIAGVRGSTGPGDPQPWYLNCREGRLWLATRWTDGVVRRFSVPIATGTTTLDVVFDIDFITHVASCNLGTVQVHDGWPDTTARLTENNVYGCGVGRVIVGPGADGYGYGEAWPHMIVRGFRAVWNNNFATPLMLYLGDAGVPTYDDAPGHVLPIVQKTPGRWAQVIHKDQTNPWYFGGGITLEDLEVQGRADACQIIHHGMFGGAVFDRCRFTGGPSNVAAGATSVAYPMKFRDCVFIHAGISNLFLSRSWGTEITGCSFLYGRETAVHTRDCNVLLSSCTNAPPGVEQRAVVLQEGGEGLYTNLRDDIEWTPDPRYRLVEVVGTSYEGPRWPTRAELKSCFYDARYSLTRLPPQLVRGYDRPGYEGHFEIVVDGRTVLAHRLLEDYT